MYCIDFLAKAYNIYKKKRIISTKLTTLYDYECSSTSSYLNEDFFKDLVSESEGNEKDEIKQEEETEIEDELKSELEEDIEKDVHEDLKVDVFSDLNIFFFENSNKEFNVDFNENVEITSDLSFLPYSTDDTFEDELSDEVDEESEDEEEEDDKLRFTLLKKKKKLKSEILSENNISYILIMKIQLHLPISGIYARL